MKKKSKKLIATLLSLVILSTGVPQASALSASLQQKRLLRSEIRIKRLIERSHRNNSRLSNLKLRLETIQKTLDAIEAESKLSKKILPLQPVKIVSPEEVISETNQNDLNPVLELGKASYYGPKLNGRRTASGEIFNDSLLTAAHKTLPFGTVVKVRNPQNGKTVTVVINDRGPHVEGRIVDLTSAAFSELDNLSRGVIDVELEIIDLAK